MGDWGRYHGEIFHQEDTNSMPRSMNRRPPSGQLLMDDHPTLFWTPCAAHCIDLMLHDICKLPIITTTVKRAIALNGYIYNHPYVLNMMRTFTEQKELIRPGVTRFATVFLTLQSIYNQKNKLRRMFTSEEWSTSRYHRDTKGKDAYETVMSIGFWNNIQYSLRATGPLVRVLRLVDSEKKPAMGYIYEAMDRAKEAISKSFNYNEAKYYEIWEIIDKRWNDQLHRPLHAAGYYLNPEYFYTTPRIESNEELNQGFLDTMARLVPDEAIQHLVETELSLYRYARGVMGSPNAIRNRALWSPGSWQPTVPSWEKKFCYSTCSIPWRKLLETKKVMNFYQNIVEWNDSAGEEAFQNAKARFWADINGLPCNISLPSPDIYIDEVDWNCVIDPELLFDLDQPLQPLDDVEDRKPGFLCSGWDSYLTSDKPVACTGWSDGAESAKPARWADAEVPVKPTGWGEDAAEPARPVHDSFTNPGWESCGKNATENEGWCSSDNNNINNGALDWNKWDNRAEDNSSWRKGTRNSCGWEQSKSNNHDPESFDDSKMGGNWGMSNNWRREGGNLKLSRYRTSRYQQRGYDFQANSYGMGNARGRKRVNFTSERPELEKRPLASRQWNAVHSCGPRNHHHHGVAEVSDTWNWEKPVS